jgi:hypothetical protein
MSTFKAHSAVIFRPIHHQGKKWENWALEHWASTSLSSILALSTGSPVAKELILKKPACGEQPAPLTLRAAEKDIPQIVVSVQA